ncbi:MAG: HD-GYP domain-containing protein [Anaerovoracaceae bacterium]|jgi:HD-GYP domain-containing protein (c-di-GMP phosphodiesterase class II)
MQNFKAKENTNNTKERFDTILYTLLDDYPEAAFHSSRVSQLCKLLGLEMELPYEEIYKLEVSGMLHDIGKSIVPRSILNKPGRLTEKEWFEVKKHPEYSYWIIGALFEMWDIGEYVLHHHERYDGLGYPLGLKGKEIPLLSRIISVADSYDAMTNPRPYKDKLDVDMAILELVRNKEKQFDPKIVDVFIKRVLGRCG